MDETVYTNQGIMTTIDFQGKLYADTPEGVLFVRCESATLMALDTVGAPISNIQGQTVPDGVTFALDGTIPAVHFLLEREW